MNDEGRPNQTLLEFQQNNVYTDLTVTCTNGRLECHRALLSLCFPWSLSPDLDCLILPDTDFRLFKDRLESFYLCLNPAVITDILYNSCKLEPGQEEIIVVHCQVLATDEDPQDDCELNLGGDVATKRGKRSTELEKRYFCDLCNRNCGSTARLKQHMKIHSEIVVTFNCDDCNQVFQNKSFLKKHMRIHASLQCKVCEESFEKFDDFLHHKKIHQPVKCRDMKRSTCIKVEEHPCEYCEYKTNNAKNLRRHIEYNHLGIKYECPECGDMFSSKSSLYIHSRVHSDDRPFVCTECGDRFKWKKNLESHMDNKHRTTTVLCTQCHREFKSQIALDYHLKSHDVSQQFPCAVCGKRFVTRTKLKMHTNIHTGQKPYKCPNLSCGKGYHSSDQLSHHKKSCTKFTQPVLKESPVWSGVFQ